MTDGAVRRRAGLPLTIVTAVALAILVTLGTWQLQRLEWKRDLIARVAALKQAPAEPIAAVLRRIADGQDVDFVRVQARCRTLGPRTVNLYSLHDGAPGWRPVAACSLSEGPHGAVLVDLGFRGGDAGALPEPVSLQFSGQPLEGVLRRPSPTPWFERLAPRPSGEDDGRWFRRDIPGMAAALGASNPAPLMLSLEQPALAPGVAPTPLPAEIPNRHLEYAVTWYGLALALVAVYIAMLLRDRKA